MYRSEERESEDHVIERAISVLDRIFDVMDDTYISITGHGGIINGFLRGMGHGYYSLPTGGIMPLVVRGDMRPIAGDAGDVHY